MIQENSKTELQNWEIVSVNPSDKIWDWKDLFCFWGNNIQSIIGFSLMQLVAHPFNTSLIMHIFWAMNIFWGAQIWIAALAYARGELDANVLWRDWSINRIRWSIFAVALISFQAMMALVATGHLVESAILEWTLTFSAEAMMLTMIPTLTNVASA